MKIKMKPVTKKHRPMTNAERVAKFRAERKAKGYYYRTIWVNKEFDKILEPIYAKWAARQ